MPWMPITATVGSLILLHHYSSNPLVYVSIFRTIQDMNFFLRTGFGAKDFASATGDIKTQGMCQGNGAAPAGWMVDSIAMIQAHKQKVHGIHLQCPISNKTIHLAGTFIVDDTDLEHLDLNKSESIVESNAALQESIINWGPLLLATGGSFKPAKCFYHMISFSGKPDGDWKHDSNESLLDLSIVIPLADGTLASIKHLPVSTPIKTLGQMTCLTRCSTGANLQMKEKAQKWIDMAKGGKLHKRNVWFLLDKQFWTGVSFVISSIRVPYAELDQCMMRIYYNLLLICGIRWSVNRKSPQMNRGFYGCGFPHPGVECFIAQLNKLLTNYGCNSQPMIHLQTSMELMIVEGGVLMQILSQLFQWYSKWVTNSWLKSLWEKMDLFNLKVEIKELPLKMPRERNNWLMLVLEREGYSDNKLIRLVNWVQCHQQVLFYLDIFDMRGRLIDRRYLTRRTLEESWSRLIFPRKNCLPAISTWGQRLWVASRE